MSIYEFFENDHLLAQFTELRKIEQVCAELNFDQLQTQFDLSCEETDFKHVTGRFLMLSDRLDRTAYKLGAFINEKTCGHVLGVISNTDELEKKTLPADYLIIVGYLEDESNFEVLEKIRANNNQITIIFYATYSLITSRQMNKYGIHSIFDRYQSLDSFLKLF